MATPSMRVRVKRLGHWLRTGLTPHLGPAKRVRYLGWDAPKHTLDERVDRDLCHPAKGVALDWLEREPGLPARFSLLDVGCGPGAFPAMIERRPQLKGRVIYTGIDQSEAALARCRATFKGDFTFISLDLQKQPIPGRYDVVTIHEVVEHLPNYRSLVDAALALKPRIFILTTFAVNPGRRRDRLRWNSRSQAYMNTYAFETLYEYLRGKTDQIWIADLGTQRFTREWFPEKTLLVFYLRLDEKPVRWTEAGWVVDGADG